MVEFKPRKKEIEETPDIKTDDEAKIILNTLASEVAHVLMLNGYPVLDNEPYIHFLVAMQFVNASMCKSIGEEHPLQKITEKIISEIVKN